MTSSSFFVDTHPGSPTSFNSSPCSSENAPTLSPTRPNGRLCFVRTQTHLDLLLLEGINPQRVRVRERRRLSSSPVHRGRIRWWFPVGWEARRTGRRVIDLLRRRRRGRRAGGRTKEGQRVEAKDGGWFCFYDVSRCLMTSYDTVSLRFVRVCSRRTTRERWKGVHDDATRRGRARSLLFQCLPFLAECISSSKFPLVSLPSLSLSLSTKRVRYERKQESHRRQLQKRNRHRRSSPLLPIDSHFQRFTTKGKA